MRTAAEFHGDVAHLHHADGIAVLLAEQSRCAQLLGLFNGQHQCFHGFAGKRALLKQCVDLCHFLIGHSGEMSKVEAQVVRLHQ